MSSSKPEAHHNHTDPRIIGPGYWSAFHTIGVRAITYDKKKEYVNFVKMLEEDFPCLECRRHIIKYVKANPPVDYWSIKDVEGKDIGMFTHSWMFHNAVNSRLNKPILDFNTAYNLYTESGVCASDCGGGKHNDTLVEGISQK